MFQSAVNADIAAGVVGELAFEGPLNGQPAILNSPDAAQNVIGRAFTHNAGVDLSVRAGGTGAFAGILSCPKEYASAGTSAGGTLANTLTLRNGEVGDFVQETPGIYVLLPGPADIGDLVTYNTTTGILASVAPDADPAAGAAFVPGAVVVRYNIAAVGGGLAVIGMHGPLPVPVVA